MRFLTLSALILLAACQPAPPPEMTDADRQAIAEEVQETMGTWFAEWADMSEMAGNPIELMMADYVADPGAYFVGEPAMYLNRLVLLTDLDAIREYWAPAMETRSGNRTLEEQAHIAVLSTDHALYVFKGRWEVLDLEGKVSSSGPITATFVLAKESGEWKQLHYHQSWDRDVEE